MFTYAVGDVHGKLNMLVDLMKKIDNDAGTADYKLVFIGDYIDRGEDSKGVLDLLIDMKARRDARGLETVYLMGNHEDMCVNYEYADSWLMNGGFQTNQSYPNGMVSLDHVEFMKNLPLYHETEKNIFVHASAKPNIPLSEQSSTILLWTRYKYKESSGLSKILIHGHTPCKHIEQVYDRVNLDTGAVFGHNGYGRLTAAKIDPSTGQPVEFLQVKEDLIPSRVDRLHL